MSILKNIFFPFNIGINLNSGIILTAIGFNGKLDGNSNDVWDALFKNAVGNVCIALMGTVPGYWYNKQF